MEGGQTSDYVDYTEWVVGSTNPLGGWYTYGLTAENERVEASDPWGRKTIIWTGVPSGSGSLDGGFFSPWVAIDNTKLYRFSCWQNRTVLGTDGNQYFGLYGGIGSTNDGVELLSTGANNTNPYFWASVPSTSYTPEGEWILIVGHVFPYTTEVGTSDHVDSGRYHLESGLYYNTGGSYNYDFRWRSVTTHTRLRSILYDDLVGTARISFCYPRIDLVDGTEPSVSDLLRGPVDNNRYTGISKKSIVYAPSFSEVGPSASSLLNYWSFDGDNINHGYAELDSTINGSPSFSEGLRGKQCVVLADGDYYTFDTNDTAYLNFGASDDFSVSFWFKSSNIGNNRIVFNGGIGPIVGWNIYIASLGYARLRCVDDSANSFNADTTQTNLLDGDWHFIAATRDAVNNLAIIYYDGEYSAEIADPTGDLASAEVFCIGRDTYNDTDNAIGSLQDVRIYNTVLTGQEIGILYKMRTDTATTSSQISGGEWYVSGEFKEMI